ncbi:MAG: 1,4-alpha-glucan branching enzyme, partial [Bifidobacteriaceae bacterium]|nr:1,4-alpha-glucan branching enzyme [Bifidobacteriaceae bacterium]
MSSNQVPPQDVNSATLAAVAAGAYYDPHSVLGAHLVDGVVTLRTLRPLADQVVFLLADGARLVAEHLQDGIWVAALAAAVVPDYRVEVTYGQSVSQVDDPYRFLPTVGELDLHLISQGRHERLWDALGARVLTFPSVMGDVTGTAFAVWAPNAQAVRVVGDFNSWTSGATAMRSLGASGVWEVFVPDVGVGTRYKYEIQTREGDWLQKADPMARATEVPPATASVVTANVHQWADQQWMTKRAKTNPHFGPMSIYEMHIGSWKEGLGYRDLAKELPEYLNDLGFTHVEFLPVAEHPFGGSWGYQVSSYYATSARYGTPDDFRYLVDQLHQAGIGVIIDWVPAHFPKDAFALARFDGTALYEYPDPQRGEHPDWGTLVFNYGRNEVRNFLMANATYWLEEFHADGLRVDAVASMLYLDYSREPGQWSPNAYGGRENLEAIAMLQEVTATAYKRSPGVVMVAEESTAWPGVTAPTAVGGLGFGLKWNMGWMNDTLRYLAE